MKFIVLVEGIGFEAVADGCRRAVGFYANRAVTAESVDQIDHQTLFRDLRSELLAQNVASSEKSQMRITRVSEHQESRQSKHSGFSFYEEDTH